MVGDTAEPGNGRQTGAVLQPPPPTALQQMSSCWFAIVQESGARVAQFTFRVPGCCECDAPACVAHYSDTTSGNGCILLFSGMVNMNES